MNTMKTAGDKYAGQTIQALRQERELTQEDLANRMRFKGYKWSKATVGAIETGERPLRLTEAKDVLDCLGLDERAIISLVNPDEHRPLNIAAAYVLMERDKVYRDLKMLAFAYYQLVCYASSMLPEQLSASEEDKRLAIASLSSITKDDLYEYFREALINEEAKDPDKTSLKEPWASYLRNAQAADDAQGTSAE